MARDRLLLMICSLLLICAPASAETDAELLRELRALKSAIDGLSAQVTAQQERITALESENRTLKVLGQGAPASAREPVPGRAAESSQVALELPREAPAAPRTVGQFNPDIGLVADIVAKLTQDDEDAEGNDRLSVRHAELIIGHDVDPYSRFDALIAFSDTHGVELEEAYLTHWGLPLDTKGKFGRFRPRIGLASAVHPEQLDSVDEPLMVSQYLGEEGLFKTGLELSNFIPFAWEDPAVEVSVGILEGGVGEEGQLFGSTERRPTFYTRVRGGTELSDVSSLELGGTFLLGSADEDAKNEVRAFGADVVFTHSFNAINRLKLQAEALFQDRSEGFIDDADEEEAHEHSAIDARSEDDEDSSALLFDKNPWGMYFLADYRLSERFGVGARFDLVEPINKVQDANRSNDIAYNAMLTFHQSEFARWRVQYQYLDRVEEGRDNRFFLQGTFAIGVHKHKLN